MRNTGPIGGRHGKTSGRPLRSWMILSSPAWSVYYPAPKSRPGLSPHAGLGPGGADLKRAAYGAEHA